MLFFGDTFPVSSDEKFWDVFSEFDCVVSSCMSILSHSVFCVAFLFYMSYNTISYMFLVGIAVEARSVDLFDLTFVVWSF